MSQIIAEGTRVKIKSSNIGGLSGFSTGAIHTVAKQDKPDDFAFPIKLVSGGEREGVHGWTRLDNLELAGKTEIASFPAGLATISRPIKNGDKVYVRRLAGSAGSKIKVGQIHTIAVADFDGTSRLVGLGGHWFQNDCFDIIAGPNHEEIQRIREALADLEAKDAEAIEKAIKDAAPEFNRATQEMIGRFVRTESRKTLFLYSLDNDGQTHLIKYGSKDCIAPFPSQEDGKVRLATPEEIAEAMQ